MKRAEPKRFVKKKPSEEYLQLLGDLKNTTLTLECIGEKYNLTRERVRQIALAHNINCKVRRLARSRELITQQILDRSPLFRDVWFQLREHGLRTASVHTSITWLIVEDHVCTIRYISSVIPTSPNSVRLYGRAWISYPGRHIIVFDNPFEEGVRSYYIFRDLKKGMLYIPANKETSPYKIRQHLMDRSAHRNAWDLLKD